MNAQGNSTLHILARETGRKYEDLYAEYHGTMKFWGDDKLTAKQTARIERIRAERAERKVDKRDSPNIFPYKKCGICSERSSCGNYDDEEDCWICEDCASK